jgi:hypothetical protein
MKTYTLKSIAQRGTMLGAAFALAVSTVTPFAPAAFADALNPLTDRSLTLSSSSPGWDFLDGSGNTTYAPPNSGANGQKTGNTFDFKVSTDTTGTRKIEAITFQYCTTSAGNCLAPGDNAVDTSGGAGNHTRETNTEARTAGNQTSDLEVVKDAGAAEIASGDFSTIVNTASTEGLVQALPNRDGSEGNWAVYSWNGSAWVQSTGWSMAVSENQVINGSAGSVGDSTSTGTDNYITLTNASGDGFTSGTRVKVVFFATDDTYITNPGSGAFFVKINTYDDETLRAESNLIDGGVTVANVMNRSINIQTKVLETMDFSVGTVDPYTLDSTGGATSQFGLATGGQVRHGQCDRIVQGMTASSPKNTLLMGDENAEFSLRTDKTYSTHSYWRLSSNSSAGATVYYSGETLNNTVNDKINAIGTSPSAPVRGTPQFGLALANGSIADNDPLNLDLGTETSVHLVDYSRERDTNKVYQYGADNAAGASVHATVATDITAQTLDASYHNPRLWPLIPAAEYDQGAGVVNGGSDYGAGGTGPATTEFAFDPNATSIPAVLASQDQQVVDCVTAKVRYIANIAATTPAGIYTTKINFIAAPQY